MFACFRAFWGPFQAPSLAYLGSSLSSILLRSLEHNNQFQSEATELFSGTTQGTHRARKSCDLHEILESSVDVELHGHRILQYTSVSVVSSGIQRLQHNSCNI
eukprot:793315-Rhodomonas_salina.1